MSWALVNFNVPGAFLGNLGKDKLERLDPHLVWAYLTYLQSPPNQSTPIPVMFEAKRSGSGNVQVPAYVKLIAGTAHLFSPFFTGFVRLDDLSRFAGDVERFRIAVVGLPTTVKQGPAPTPMLPNPLPERHDVVIGVIDHGIAFASKRFAVCDAQGRWHSRIERIWDQQWGYPRRPDRLPAELQTSPDRSLFGANYWKSVRHYGYGRHLTNVGGRSQIDFWLNRGLSEDAVYRHLRYLPAQHDHAHGTHVLSVAAGRLRYALDDRDARPVEIINDAASVAPIIAVQLPALPYKDTSGMGLCVQILDAVSYIALHAAGRKVVINLSDGAYGGPHDGSSLLERALDGYFSPGHNRRAFVVAAGNQFNEKVHWKAQVPPHGETELKWRVLPDDNSDSHLEIWPESNCSPENLQVRVTPPGRPTSQPVSLGQSWELQALTRAGHRNVAAVMFPRDPPNAAPPRGPRAMVHIAVEATRPKPGSQGATAPHGIWKVSLKNTGNTAIEIDAYIERDNPALGDAGPRRQSYFVHPGYPRAGTTKDEPVDDNGNPSPMKRMGALNNVASSGAVLVVGGYVLRTGQLAPYSASGPGRAGANVGVDVLAVSDSSRVVHGVRADGVRTASSFRMDGTSVATPQVARWIANWMASGAPAETNWRSVLNPYASKQGPVLRGPLERIGEGRLAAWGAPGGPSAPIFTTAPATPSTKQSSSPAPPHTPRPPGPPSGG